MKIILYSTHCPMCKVLEKKLKNKNIDFSEINDINIMTEKGFMSVPMLEVEIDGEIKIMNFALANDWINKQ